MDEIKLSELRGLLDNIGKDLIVENENSPDQKKYPEKHLVLNDELIRTSYVLSVYSNTKYKDSTIPKNYITQAGTKGSAIHDAIENFITNGESSNVEIKTIDYIYVDFLDAGIEGYKAQSTTTISMEKRIGSKTYKTSSKPDGYRYDNNSRKYILSDFKTNANTDLSIGAAQLGIYKYTLEEWGLPVDEVEIIYIKRDQYTSLVEVTVFKFDEQQLKLGENLFKSCYNIYMIAKKEKK